VTAAVAPVAGRPWLVWLVALYVVALLALPADFGLHVGGIVITPARAVLLAAVALALAEWRSWRAILGGVPRLVWFGWAAFLLAALVTALAAPSSATWARYGSLVIEGLIVFALVCAASAVPDGLRTLVVVFVATLAAVAAAALVLALFGIHYDRVLSDVAGSAALPDVTPRYGFERQAGPFRAPLFFAIWLTAGSALLLPALAAGARRIRWLALTAWLVLLVAVVTLTASRLAMTTMFVIPGVYFLARRPRIVGVACLVAAVAIALGLVALIPASPAVTESNELRLAAINPALQAIQARPLFGWGLLSDSTVLSSIIGKTNAVDDTYLSLAVEMGLVGLAAFALLVASIVAATRRGWRSARGLALALAVVSVLAMAAFASVFQVTQGYAALSVLAALGVSSSRR
jgi:hypothetical protein